MTSKTTITLLGMKNVLMGKFDPGELQLQDMENLHMPRMELCV